MTPMIDIVFFISSVLFKKSPWIYSRDLFYLVWFFADKSRKIKLLGLRFAFILLFLKISAATSIRRARFRVPSYRLAFADLEFRSFCFVT